MTAADGNKALRLSGLFGKWRHTLGQRPHLQAIISNTGWLIFDRMIRLLFGLAVGAWVARYLGPSQFGHLAYVVAFIAFFQAIAKLGADGIVVRDLVHAPQQSGRTLGTLFVLRLIAGSVGWLAAIAIVAITSPGDRQLLLLTAIIGSTVVFQAADTVDLWFQSQSQSRRTVVAKLVAYVCSNGLKVLLILNEAPLMAFAFATAMDFFLCAIGLWVAYRRFPASGRWLFTMRLARQLLTQSWPFLLSSLSIIIYMRIDQIMIKAIRGEHELGIYAAALPLSQLWQAIPVTLATSLAPYVARKKLEGPEAYEQALLYTYRLLGGLSLFVSILTAVAAPWIVPLFYGPDYTAAISVLAIHVFSNIFVALGIAQGLWLANEGAGHINLLKTLSGAVVAVLGNAIAIPRLGAEGAAIICVLSFATAAVLSNLLLAPQILLYQLGINRKLRWHGLIPSKNIPKSNAAHPPGS